MQRVCVCICHHICHNNRAYIGDKICPRSFVLFFFTKKIFFSSYFLNFDRIIVVVGIVILNNHKRRHCEIIIHSALISEIRKYDPEYPKSGYMTVIRIHSPLTQSWANRCLKFRLNSSRCSLTSCKYC